LYIPIILAFEGLRQEKCDHGLHSKTLSQKKKKKRLKITDGEEDWNYR
jgi:hypothetical protein